MNIYIARRTDNHDYDEYDALIIVATNAVMAQLIIANGPDYGRGPIGEYFTGFRADNYMLVLIGTTIDNSIKPGMILGSFNAG
jgi:hypothetical protein